MIYGYIRCSTAEQSADDKTSLSTQRQRIIGAALMRGVKESDVVVYEDKGVSGSISLSERPHGGKMFAELKSGDIVISSKLDRLFRSASDALNTVEQLQKRGVGVILADIGPDIVTENGTAKLFFSMLAAFAEFERNRICERMRDGKKGKRAQGGHVGGSAPYGFRAMGKGRGAILVPHESEQSVVALIRSLSETKGSRKIAAELERRGILNRRGNPIAHNQVSRIMKNVPIHAAE